MRWAFLLMTLLFAAPGGCAAPARSERLTLTMAIASGDIRRFPVVIEIPAGFDASRDRAVFLFAGGLQTDADWTVPGFVGSGDTRNQLTLDGRDTRDGVVLSHAFVERGYAVVRYGSIHLGDAAYAADPGRADPMDFADTVALAALVWDTGRDRLGVAPDRCVAVGHSLGAPRSVYATASRGESAGAYVMIAGAYTSPTRRSPRALVGAVTADDLDQASDLDGSGSVDAFEAAARRAIRDGSFRDAASFSFGGTVYPWACDELIAGGIPVLAVWGGLDPMSYHGPVLTHVFDAAGSGAMLTTRWYPRLGHQLGPEREGLVGPMDAGVIEALVDWVEGLGVEEEAVR